MRRAARTEAMAMDLGEASPVSTRFVACGICCRSRAEDETISLFRDDKVVFAVCRDCTRDHDIVMRPSVAGVQVLAKPRESTLPPPKSESRIAAARGGPRRAAASSFPASPATSGARGRRVGFGG